MVGIGWAAGALLAGAKPEQLEHLSQFGSCIGLAFQIVDDILDITSTQEELGKSIGKDIQAQKATYPSIWGLDESRQQADNLIQAAKDELAIFGHLKQPLVAIADYITARTH